MAAAERARALDPSVQQGIRWLAELYRNQGRLDDAKHHLHRDGGIDRRRQASFLAIVKLTATYQSQVLIRHKAILVSIR